MWPMPQLRCLRRIYLNYMASEEFYPQARTYIASLGGHEMESWIHYLENTIVSPVRYAQSAKHILIYPTRKSSVWHQSLNQNSNQGSGGFFFLFV